MVDSQNNASISQYGQPGPTPVATVGQPGPTPVTTVAQPRSTPVATPMQPRPTPVATLGQPTPSSQLIHEDTLPFTGFNVISVALAGAVMLVIGLILLREYVTRNKEG